MHSAHLETIYASVSVATTRYPERGGGVPKQVWTGLQWSLPDATGRGWELGGKGLMSGGGLGALYSEVQCIMGNGNT